MIKTVRPKYTKIQTSVYLVNPDVVPFVSDSFTWQYLHTADHFLPSVLNWEYEYLMTQGSWISAAALDMMPG